MPLIDRQAILQIGPPGLPGREFRGIRGSFSIKMTRGNTPNKGKITADNLSRESASLMQQPKAVVRLTLGYDVPRLVFQGEPVKAGVRERKQGPDRLLIIEAQDGGLAWRSARLALAFDGPTTLGQVFDVVVEQLALPTGVIRIDRSFQFPNGLTLYGKASDVLDRLAVMSDGDWFIRDGVVNLINRDGDTGEPAVKFSSVTGNLIGDPEPTDKGLKITALLEPSMRPGRAFVVESERFNGVYIARDVSFIGDSGFDNSFYVVITGRPRTGT